MNNSKPIYCALVETSEGKRVMCDVIEWPLTNKRTLMPDAYVKAQTGHPFGGQKMAVVNQSRMTGITAKVKS